MIMSLVASGLFQYPFMTCGPLMMSSPSFPVGISVVPSSRSTILTSVSGTGMPTLPGLRLPFRGLTLLTGEVSVSP